MYLQKLTSLGHALARRNVLSPGVKPSMIIPSRQTSKILVLRPENPYSTTELIIMSVIFSCSVLFIPAWVVFNMKNYTESIRNSA